MRALTFEDRFWTTGKVEFTETCWNWVAAKDRGGYGNFQNLRAHRVAYELSLGPIPAGMYIDHICHNTACVKPDHLRLATAKQNGENRIRGNSNGASGVRGVSWSRHSRSWRVIVIHNGSRHNGGHFKDLADAEDAAIALRNSLFTHNDADRSAA